MAEKTKWEFAGRLRSGVFGWKSSPLACRRIKEAVSEITRVAKTDPVEGALGAIRFMEKVWPALQNVDSSSGALGTAVNHAVDALVPVIALPAVDRKTRMKWLERLFIALQEDGVGYISILGDRWGEVCQTPEIAAHWADTLSSTLKLVWTGSRPGRIFAGDTACLSSLLAAGRPQKVLDLLSLRKYPFWSYARFGIQALLDLGKPGEALLYAETIRGLNQPEGLIDRTCEEILLAQGKVEEAYRTYGLGVQGSSTYLARFREVARRYPAKEKKQILLDLVGSTPGEEGKWFATAKTLGFYELAIKLAMTSPCDPRTLTRAARDLSERQPEFAIGAGIAALTWISRGYGYDILTTDILEAVQKTLEAAKRLDLASEIRDQIRKILNGPDSVLVPAIREYVSGTLSRGR